MSDFADPAIVPWRTIARETLIADRWLTLHADTCVTDDGATVDWLSFGRSTKSGASRQSGGGGGADDGASDAAAPPKIGASAAT